jgi:hypothetical protein
MIRQQWGRSGWTGAATSSLGRGTVHRRYASPALGRSLQSQLAEVLSAVTGRTVVHRDTDVDEGMMAMIGPAIRAGVLERQTEDLEQILGRPASSLRNTVAAALHDLPSDPGREGLSVVSSSPSQ